MENDLKRAWRETGRSLESSDCNIDFNRTTSLDRLASRYRRFAILSSCCIFMSVAFLNQHIFPKAGIWLALCMIVYFLTAALMDWWLYYGVRSIDCQRMSVTDVISKAYGYRKRHFIFMAILFPMAIALFCAFIYVADGDRYMILGIALGGAIGLILGFNQFMLFLRDYRSLRN